MMRYTDSLAIEYLNKLRRLKTAAKKTVDNIARWEVNLANKDKELAAPIACYGEKTGQAKPGSSVVERMSMREEMLREKINRAKVALYDLRQDIYKLAIPLEYLLLEERDITTEHFVEGYNWTIIGNKHHRSRQWAYNKGVQGVKNLAGILRRPEFAELIRSYLTADNVSDCAR